MGCDTRVNTTKSFCHLVEIERFFAGLKADSWRPTQKPRIDETMFLRFVNAM